MFKLIKCEFLKLNHMISIIISFLFPLLCIIIGFININSGKVKISGADQMWNAIYVQSASLYGGILFPAFLCIIIAMQWRVEFKNNNINNLLITDIPQSHIYLSKIITTFLIATLNIIVYIAIIFTAVKVFLPKESVKSFVFYAPLIGLICSLPLICIQHFVSMNFKNFALPLTVGIILSFPNAIISCYSFSKFFPYSYICRGMFFNVSSDLTVKFENCIFVYGTLLFIALTAAGIKIFKSKDFR
ncbi:ABC transporter permease [Clostridium neuense]|uniref:ABC transporter permease n=1 Tax=Clostridium neuense TaxID=1728934 RepID=A0ABW8TP61_9CLOT